MSEPAPARADDPLWRRLAASPIGPTDTTLTFTAKLARENGWSVPLATRVIEECRRFCYLGLTARHEVTPVGRGRPVLAPAPHLHARLLGAVLPPGPRSLVPPRADCRWPGRTRPPLRAIRADVALCADAAVRCDQARGRPIARQAGRHPGGHVGSDRDRCAGAVRDHRSPDPRRGGRARRGADARGAAETCAHHRRNRHGGGAVGHIGAGGFGLVGLPPDARGLDQRRRQRQQRWRQRMRRRGRLRRVQLDQRDQPRLPLASAYSRVGR